MIKQWLQKRAKVAFGLLNSIINRGNNYDSLKWWDTAFYVNGISDRQTIAPRKSSFTAKYHYASVEMQILKHLQNNSVDMDQGAVLDIGSGSGHWIDFYNEFEPHQITGMDVSVSSFNYLKNKYSENTYIDIHQGKAIEVINQLEGSYNLVNAIGVMFHIVDDLEWQNTIQAVGDILKKDGLFVVGGHFGLLNGLNVQIDNDDNINKRLRSKTRWVNTLRNAGFTNIKMYKNNAYLYINDVLPENNVIIAKK